MFINKQSVQLISSMGSDLSVVNAARVSFGSTKQELDAKDEKLIKYLADHKHMSPFEHCTATFLIKCPIYISKQIMRHRTFSYNEISRRYTSKDIEFYVPPVFRAQAKSNRQASEGTIENNEFAKVSYEMQLGAAYAMYQALLSDGICREQARGILPQALMTEFYMTGNLRNWAHFLSLRLPKDAQGEVQELAQMLQKELTKLYPISLDALSSDN